MLKRGQIIRVPRDTTEQRWARDITVEGEVGGLHNIDGDDTFIIVDTLAAREDIDEGDYLAVERGRFRLCLLRKEVAEGWDLEADPAQEDERRTLNALQAELDKAQEEIARLHALVGAEQTRAEAYNDENREIVRALEEAGQLRAGKDPVGAVRELSLTIAAERGMPEGAPSERWVRRNQRWEVLEDGLVAAYVSGGSLHVRTRRDGLTTWSYSVHRTDRSAMIFADTKLEQR